MDEYIEREALLKELAKDVAVDGNQRAAQILECIINAPAADVAPVVRGYEKAALENPAPSSPRQHWITQILSERDRQDAKWGFPQENTYCEWSSILAEETGELAKELNELNFGRGSVDRMAEEAVQVAAVALSILEHQEIAHIVTAAWFAYRHRPKEG